MTEGNRDAAPKKRARSVREGLRAEDRYERERALNAVESEKEGSHDRFLKAHAERSRRMRSRLIPSRSKLFPSRIEEKNKEAGDAGIDMKERIRRIGILLRARAYDLKWLERQPNVIDVEMRRSREPDESDSSTAEWYTEHVRKKDIVEWLRSLSFPEFQRLYVLGRKRIDFKFNEKEFLRDYFERNPENRVQDEDSPEEKARKAAVIQEAIENEKLFQSEQKELADAFEVVGVPMLRAVFEMIGVKVDVYLAGHPDDIAGGLDIVVEFLNNDGTPKYFHDRKPMKLVVDVTYARMNRKAKIDLDRGRLSKEAYDILRGDSERVHATLSNARAMKMFRTVVETLGGTMSTQTFGKDKPLEESQEHVPRLIGGLDWANAFSAISNWVEFGDAFEERFRQTQLARRLMMSVNNQLVGLHALADREPHNPNVLYLSELIKEIGLEGKTLEDVAYDQSLNNLDTLVTTKTEPLMTWQRERLYEAARAQIAHELRRGKRVRGDLAELPEEEPTKVEEAPAAPHTEEPVEEESENEDVLTLEEDREKTEELIERLKRLRAEGEELSKRIAIARKVS